MLGVVTVGLLAQLVFHVPGVIDPWRHRMDEYREAISRSAAVLHPVTPSIASADRILVERMCDFARARDPALASQVSRRSLYFLHTTGQVWHDCSRRPWHDRGEGTPRFVAECLHGRRPCGPPLGGLAIHAGRNPGFRTCHVVVLVQDLATRQTRSARRSPTNTSTAPCASTSHRANAYDSSIG